jgi:hypothetical protein
MRNTLKLIGIVVLAATIGFSFAACGDAGGGGNGNNNGGGDGIAVTLNSVTANGNEQQTTTQLTLTFGQAISGLSAADITLSAGTKGTLSGYGSAYMLYVSGFTSTGPITVTVRKAGYNISGSPKTVTVFAREPDPTPGSNSEYDYLAYANRITITNYKGSESAINIPSNIAGKQVTAIGGAAFRGLKSLVSITIPNSVTKIEDGDSTLLSGAFTECTNLANISLPNSFISIGSYAFSSCNSLVRVTLPNSVTNIGRMAFALCENLVSINIPYGVTVLDGIFYGCDKITGISIPNSVTSITDGAFLGCVSLTSITIPSSVTTIGNMAFYGCNSLSSITIPDTVTSIGGVAFWFCTSLASVTFQGTIPSDNFSEAFDGDLRSKFYAVNSRNGTAGTYIRSGTLLNYTWTKQ